MKFCCILIVCTLMISEGKLRSEEQPQDRELKTCKLTNKEFTGECNYSTVKDRVLASFCTEAEFLTMLGVSNEGEAEAAVTQLCDGADLTSREKFIPWSKVTDQGYQFDKEFFNGGTIFNEDYATADAPDLLATQTARLKEIESIVLKKKGISWPSSIENFSDESCDEPVAMCCWTADRDKVGTGSCSGIGCQNENPVNNTDVCYFDSRDSTFAAHVIDATTVFNGDSEGPVHCRGFTFKTDLETKYAGNTLFQVAMSYGLMGNGYVREIQGAPMCGCIKTMPKVTSAGCTSTTVTEKWALTKNNNDQLEIKLSATDISFGDCAGKTLEAEFEAKNGRNVNGNLLGDCSTTEATYLADKGIKKNVAEWIPVAGSGALYHETTPESEFREIWKQSSNQILRRICPTCRPSHRNIYYRRFDRNGLPEDLDLLYVVTDYWHTTPSIQHNDFNTDFSLYSTYEDALMNVNHWTYCNFNDRNVGFPRDCGPTGWVPSQWNSKTFNAPQRHVRFYVEKADSQKVQMSDATWAVCGRMGLCPEGYLRVANELEKHEVRCCSDNEKSGWEKRTWCDVWSESELPQCYSQKSFLEATTICSNVGARLCTRVELEKGCSGMTGCGHDANLIWSSTKYEETDDTGSEVGQHITACGSSAAPCKNRADLEDDNTEHEVRCCSDTALEGWRKWGHCAVWGESDIGYKCHHSNTYEEARLICKAHGGRLCTKEELLSDCTKWSGCGHDADMIWSSSLS